MMRIHILRRGVCDTDAGSHDHAQPPRRILMEAVPRTQGIVIGPEGKRSAVCLYRRNALSLGTLGLLSLGVDIHPSRLHFHIACLFEFFNGNLHIIDDWRDRPWAAVI